MCACLLGCDFAREYSEAGVASEEQASFSLCVCVGQHAACPSAYLPAHLIYRGAALHTPKGELLPARDAANQERTRECTAQSTTSSGSLFQERKTQTEKNKIKIAQGPQETLPETIDLK